MSTPDLTVLVLGPDGDLTATLASLAAQDVDDFEVVVVLDPTDADGLSVVDRARSSYAGRSWRVVQDPDPSRQRQSGSTTARGTSVTVVGRGDVVSPDFLRRLRTRTAPGLVPVAPVAASADEPEADLFVPNGTHALAGKVLPSATAAESDEDGADATYWVPVLGRTRASYAAAATDRGYAAAHPPPWDAPPTRSFEDEVLPLLDDMERLRATQRLPHGLDRVGAVAWKARARRLNAYLRGRPEDHPRLMEEVRRRRIASFPWPLVNRGLARDLAICYCFPPYQDTSGLVAARRLRERGVVTDVISGRIDDLRPLEPETALVPAEVVGEAIVLDTPQNFVTWRSVARFTRRAEAEMTMVERERGPYERLYTRAMAVHSSYAGALVKLRRPDLPWHAELSDPLAMDPNGEIRPNRVVTDDRLFEELTAGVRAAGFGVPDDVALFELGEVLTYALADRIVFTNEHQRDFMLGYCRDPRLAERARAISQVAHHPTLPPDFYQLRHPALELDPDRVHVAYFGVFYLTRALGEVTEALARLPDHVRRRLTLHVFTNRDLHLEIGRFLGDLADVVALRPFVPYLDFLNLTTRFDVLLVNDAQTQQYLGVNPYLPSKLSDYRGSGTPVWSLTEEGSVLDGMDTAYTSRIGDEEGALQVLIEIVRDRFPEVDA